MTQKEFDRLKIGDVIVGICGGYLSRIYWKGKLENKHARYKMYSMNGHCESWGAAIASGWKKYKGRNQDDYFKEIEVSDKKSRKKSR